MAITAGRAYAAQNQGTAITPRTVEVEVVWVDGDNVHYRKAGESLVHQTTAERFAEIVGEPGRG